MRRRDFLRAAGLVTAGSGLVAGTGCLPAGCSGNEMIHAIREVTLPDWSGLGLKLL